jgi:O-antigen/teichoic acid export membrane protein
MIPGYSRLTGEVDAFRKTCIDASSGLLLIVLPASVGIAVIAGPIVRLLLGEQWVAAVPIIQVLALTGVVNAIISNNHAAYVALGRPFLSSVIHLSRIAVMLPAIIVLSQRMGLMGVVYAELFAALVCLFISYPILFREIRIPMMGYLSAVWRPIIASISMATVVNALLKYNMHNASLTAAIHDLMIGIPVGALSYVAVLWLLWAASGRPKSMETDIYRFAISALRPSAT